MLLAAGLGTRLRPLTDHTPKALVEVCGTPVLETVARRLIAAGADRLIVNVHHHAGKVERFLADHGGWGVEVAVSHEPDAPLETGGGLLHARDRFRADTPFFLHNADILTDADLCAMYAAHRASGGALATLAVMDRPSSRRLLFDERGLLGRIDEGRGIELRSRDPVGRETALAFCGIHVIDPRIFDLLTERGAFSILDPYLRLTAAGERIVPHRIDGAGWLDIGKPDQLERARAAC